MLLFPLHQINTIMKSILILLCCLVSITFAQDSICFEGSEGDFFPTDTEGTRAFYWGRDVYTETFLEGTTKIGDYQYFTVVQDWGEGDPLDTMFLRRDEGGSVWQLDQDTHEDFLRFPGEPTRNFSWTTFEGKNELTILSLDTTLKTPFCDLGGLACLRRRNTETGSNFYFYYKKGVGYAGAMNKETVMSFIKPADELLDRKPARYPDCEGTFEEVMGCTMAQLTILINANFEMPKNKKSKKAHGEVEFIIPIDPTGTIGEVLVEGEMVNGAEVVEKLKSIIENLPGFLPAQIYDGRTIPYEHRWHFAIDKK